MYREVPGTTKNSKKFAPRPLKVELILDIEENKNKCTQEDIYTF